MEKIVVKPDNAMVCAYLAVKLQRDKLTRVQRAKIRALRNELWFSMTPFEQDRVTAFMKDA